MRSCNDGASLETRRATGRPSRSIVVHKAQGHGAHLLRRKFSTTAQFSAASASTARFSSSAFMADLHTASSITRYIELHRGKWRVTIAVPRLLVNKLGTRLKRNLNTDSMATANAMKWAVVAELKTVKAPQAATRGYDAGKKIAGRKRHIAVDTDGRLLMVNLTTADLSDSAGAQAVLAAVRTRWPWVKHLFADAAYDRLKLMDKAAYLDFIIEIIRRSDGQKGLPGPAAPLGGRTDVRMDDPLAAPRARLRKPFRRLPRHDPRRHGRQSHPKKRSSVSFKTDS
jgi:hypothetical protein